MIAQQPPAQAGPAAESAGIVPSGPASAGSVPATAGPNPDSRALSPTLRVVIPSKGRQGLIGKAALRLFPDATVTVAESEVAAYAGVTYPDGRRLISEEQLVPHPDDVSGIGPIRQWVLDHFDDECIVMVDDDVYELVLLVHYVPRKMSQPEVVRQVVHNAANVAQGIGAPVFGFNQAWDVRKFRPFEPFSLNSWAGGVIGIIGRDLRYDPNLRLRADIDFCLQALQRKRITFIELRFSFMHRRFGVAGGNASNRSSRRNEEEIAYLQRKWGDHLKVADKKTTTRLSIHVPRRQSGVRFHDFYEGTELSTILDDQESTTQEAALS